MLNTAGRAPKRLRAGSMAGKRARGESNLKPQEHPSTGPAQSGHDSNTKAEPEGGLLESQEAHSLWTEQERISVPPPPGKMLLPPLPRSRGENARTDKNRTSHACDKCRKAKAKCSGGQPCEKCRAEDKDCMYGDGKRDKERKEMNRLQKQIREVEQRNDQLSNALLHIASELGPKKRKELEGLVMSPSTGTDEDDEMVSNRDSDMKESDHQEVMMLGEEFANAEVGSAGSLDVINEDTNRDENTRAAGFMGKSSAVRWVQRAKKVATHDLEDERHIRRSTGTAAKGTFSDSTYHAEPGDLLTVEAKDVNALEWPPRTLAGALVDSYFTNAHGAFPILSKNDFQKRFETFPKDHVSAEDQCWLSIANMVFAVGAKHAHLTNAEFRGDDRDHLVYYARARALGMDQRTLNQDPELSHTACLGVLGLYLLATDQLNRSWTVCGIAVRHAMALGLHVRTEAKDLSDMDKELRVRLWWSLYNLERLLDELTGRPSCIADRDISTPLPINMDETKFVRDHSFYQRYRRQSIRSPAVKGKARVSWPELPTPASSASTSMDPSMASTSPTGSPTHTAYMFPMTQLPITTSTFFIYRTQLSIISHDILTKLYCAALVKARWIEVQDTIRDIDSRLEKWKASLPEEFDFSDPPTQADSFSVERKALSMFYSSSRMTLFRLCLCRVEGRIENESDRSKTFDSRCAATCIESARDILASLPSMADPIKVYTISPWWSVVHYIVQAGSVLLLELAYRAEHLPSQAGEILEDSKKAVLWLRAMSGQSVAARKGWEIFASLLQRVAPKVGGETWDMPNTAPVPPGWRGNRFGTQSKRKGVEQRTIEMQTPMQQSYSADSNRMDDWIHQATYDPQETYSAPAPIASPEAYTTTPGTLPTFLAGLYPFNEIYGRYDAFGLLPTQNSYFPYGPVQDTFQDGNIYPNNTLEGAGLVSGPSVIAPQLVPMTEIGGSGEAVYVDPAAALGTQDFPMTDYRGWNDAPNGNEAMHYPDGGG